jgi:hypothetical protein
MTPHLHNYWGLMFIPSTARDRAREMSAEFQMPRPDGVADPQSRIMGIA